MAPLKHEDIDLPKNNNFLFAYILERIVPHVSISKKIVFDFKQTKHPDYDFIDDFFVNGFLDKKNKFDVLISHCNNDFLTLEKRNISLNYFCKAQKCIWGLKKLEHLYYFKKKIIKSEIENDLTMTPLSQYPESSKIQIIQEGTLFTFFINDIIKIINTSLTYAPQVFSEPYYPKNPYINLPFTKANLYNIYFSLLSSSKIIPMLFHCFFLSNFNLSEFTINYEADIREIVLKSFYKDSTEHQKYNDIITMLRKYRTSCISLQIHPDFDKALVIYTFEHLLQHYLIHQYSYQPSKRLLSKRIINKFLYSFSKNNPTFGRLSIFDNITPSNEVPNTSQGMIDFVSNIISSGGNSSSSRFPNSANLLDRRLEDSDSVSDLLEELVNLSRVTSRRRLRATRPPPRSPLSITQPNSEIGGDSMRETSISSNSGTSIVEGGVVTSQSNNIESISSSEDEESIQPLLENIEDNLIIQNENQNQNQNQSENQSENNTLSVIGMGLSTENSIITTPARIEYSSHIVTRFPSSLSTSIVDSAINTAISLNNSNLSTSNRYHSRRDAILPTSSLASLINNNSQNFILSSNSPVIIDISNSSHDGEIDVSNEDNVEIETPNSTSSTNQSSNPFETTYPAGFDPNY